MSLLNVRIRESSYRFCYIQTQRIKRKRLSLLTRAHMYSLRQWMSMCGALPRRQKIHKLRVSVSFASPGISSPSPYSSSSSISEVLGRELVNLLWRTYLHLPKREVIFWLVKLMHEHRAVKASCTCASFGIQFIRRPHLLLTPLHNANEMLPGPSQPPP